MSDVSRETKINEAFVKLADTLIADYDVIDLLHALMEECIELLGTQAGGLMLADTLGTLELVASTSEQADFVEVMQLNAGAGPCIDCFSTGTAISVADIDETAAQWPEFRTAALQQGFHSVHATPLRLRGQIIGTMNLFGTSVGELSPKDAAVTQALADVATIGILQERIIRESGIVAEQLQRALDSRILIEQAKGVLSETGSLEMGEAFAVLRAYARNNNLSLRSVAEGVTSRSLDILSAPRAVTPKSMA
ncbi:GAF and ANTAR domain-containing protein [Parafrigoribacterium humi]|jgi:GAF domain-containing protein|uniref:GAF and ANTAR domain-containing protein n=1 Tax=Parafrigoribacterium humi TaxID=3144664 RepID=UPI0032EFF4E8